MTWIEWKIRVTSIKNNNAFKAHLFSSSTLALTYNEFHERFQMHTVTALKENKKKEW